MYQGLNENARPDLLGGDRTGIRTMDSSGGRLSLSDAQHITDGGARQELLAASGKVAATLDGDCLKKQLDGSRHFLRKPAGIAFDDAILRAAERAGARSVWVRDRETGDVYTCQLADFALHAVKVDRGFGLQYCLPFAFWRVRRAGAPVQMALWG
jgi:hypothetical protein